MKPIKIILLAILGILFCACATTNENRIEVERNSEMGRLMAELDAKGRAFQNKNVFTEALREYEESLGNANSTIVFESLEEPGKILSKGKREYVMNGKNEEGLEKKYLVHITFRDAALTVAKKVTVLESLSEEVEPIAGGDAAR